MSGRLTVKDIKDKLDDDTLDLSLCDLDEVPVREITAVNRFSHLDLSNNVLTKLPRAFATLTQIVKLDLSKNMLQELPDNFGALRQLKHLDLYSNRISRLPLSLSELKNLKWLDLKENPLTPSVAAVAGPCSDASECQACARDIVLYLTNVKAIICEEKRRRRVAAIEMEKFRAEAKKDGKKTQKKAEKKIAVKEKSLNVKKELTHEKINVSNSPKSETTSECINKSRGSSGGVISFLVRASESLTWSKFFTVVAITIVGFLPIIFNDQLYEIYLKDIEARTGVPLKHYVDEGIKHLKMFIVKTKLWTNHTMENFEKTYQQYFVEEPSINKK